MSSLGSLFYIFLNGDYRQDLKLSLCIYVYSDAHTEREAWLEFSGIWKGFPLKNIPAFSKRWSLKQTP